MIHRSITVASIPPVMTTVPAVIRPALHQTLRQAQEMNLERAFSLLTGYEASSHASVRLFNLFQQYNKQWGLSFVGQRHICGFSTSVIQVFTFKSIYLIKVWTYNFKLGYLQLQVNVTDNDVHRRIEMKS